MRRLENTYPANRLLRVPRDICVCETALPLFDPKGSENVRGFTPCSHVDRLSGFRPHQLFDPTGDLVCHFDSDHAWKHCNL